MMIVKQAKAVARQWVADLDEKIPDLEGAFLHGSVNWLPDDAPFPATSDVDIMVVLADPPPVKLGKFIAQDVMLEVSYLRSDAIQSPEQILGQSHMAGSFRGPSILLDHSGRLTALQEAVSRDFAKSHWVYRRCEHARDKVLRNLEHLQEAELFPDQVLCWVFATGVTTHMLLSAGLKNPTVRRRYVATRDLLAHYGHLDFYETLLEMLGCAHMDRQRVEQHVAALADVFDVTKTVIKTPFFFASDIDDMARPVAIDGSQALIDRGLHREAVFWVVVTYSRCMTVLAHDATEAMRERFHPAYQQLLADLGVTSYADLQRRGAQVRACLPGIWDVVKAIIASNPEIED